MSARVRESTFPLCPLLSNGIPRLKDNEGTDAGPAVPPLELYQQRVVSRGRASSSWSLLMRPRVTNYRVYSVDATTPWNRGFTTAPGYRDYFRSGWLFAFEDPAGGGGTPRAFLLSRFYSSRLGPLAQPSFKLPVWSLFGRCRGKGDDSALDGLKLWGNLTEAFVDVFEPSVEVDIEK